MHFNPIETYTVVATMFFVVLYPLVLLTYALERRLKRAG
jgi:polar amino acid transport system permease protein